MSDVHVGIDVGGTNTDAVLMEDRQVVGAAKAATSGDVTTGITNALERLFATVGIAPATVGAVMIGTTHFTNAFVEAKDLLPVAVVRLCGSATRALPPMVDWPEKLSDAVGNQIFMCAGGHEYDGRRITAVDPDELREVAATIRESGLHSVAISSVFSPILDVGERQAAELISSELPNVEVSLSSLIGRMGLLERENATIVNASLAALATRIVRSLEEAVARFAIDAPVYFSQNDGTLMSAEYTMSYPVATFASGPTNSMRGAAYLSGVQDCAVIDVGGTTTDLGVLRQGFPREASTAVEIGGIRTNFRMPDVKSLGLGGGSVVRTHPQLEVGPDSVGYRLVERGMIFGGDTLTATDVVVAAGMAELGDPAKVASVDRGIVADAVSLIRARVADALDRIKVGPEPVPVVLVGGGSILLGDDLPGASQVLRPEHFAVANAIGAAIAQVGGQVERILKLDEVPRTEALEAVRREASERCVLAGARPESVRVVEVEEVPLAYLPADAVRITVKAVGDLKVGIGANPR
ncbi:MAG TPA: hydantoinase/oxoprolinase family protein [Acidimicrobiia bacterium]|nr:hydantoinase/oxoprolinase family protein [Acidimicrobiia bacterium]